MGTENQLKRQKYVGLEKLPKGYLLGLINKIAAAFRVELSEETQAVYLEYLTDEGYSHRVTRTEPEAIVELKEYLDAAIWLVITTWDQPSKMPTLKFIMNCFEQQSDKPPQYKLLRAPEDPKPEGWEPLGADAIAEMIEQSRFKAGRKS